MKRLLKQMGNSESSEDESTNFTSEWAVSLPKGPQDLDELNNRQQFESGQVVQSDDFISRRAAAIDRLAADPRIRSGEPKQHNQWFCEAYETASGDPAKIPWAELQPESEILSWVIENPGKFQNAIEIGCGLGDNAEALAAHEWQVTAFDISDSAINWAKSRFPESLVQFVTADLLNFPREWVGAFKLVVECCNLQSFAPGPLRRRAIEAITKMIAPDGQLLLVALLGNERKIEDGPPWPLTISDLDQFKEFNVVTHTIRPNLHKQNSGVVPHVTALFKHRSF